MGRKRYHYVIGLLLAGTCLLAMLFMDKTTMAQEELAVTLPLDVTVSPDIIVSPDVTVSPDDDPKPGEIPDENYFPVSPSPTAIAESQLNKPRRFRVVQRTISTVSLRWKKVKHAEKYAVYRKKAGGQTYKKIAVTRKCKYRNTKLKAKTTYFYKILALAENEEGVMLTSDFSLVKKAKTKPAIHKTAYVGDSVMYGTRALYQHKGQKVIAKIGVSPWNFRRGDLMDQLLRYDPDRIYIMLGVNSLVGKPSRQHCKGILADYKKIIRQCKKKNPDVDIVILSVAPSTASCRSVRNSYISMYNKGQKKMAKQMKVQYYDFTKGFKDSRGYLKQKYNGGDGLHWNSPGCISFAKQLKKYERKMA